MHALPPHSPALKRYGEQNERLHSQSFLACSINFLSCRFNPVDIFLAFPRCGERFLLSILFVELTSLEKSVSRFNAPWHWARLAQDPFYSAFSWKHTRSSHNLVNNSPDDLRHGQDCVLIVVGVVQPDKLNVSPVINFCPQYGMELAKSKYQLSLELLTMLIS